MSEDSGSSEGSDTTAMSGVTAMDTTVSPTGVASGDAESGTAGSSTGPLCVPGEENCACGEEQMCNEGLGCIEDVCIANFCGNGQVDEGEDCDDGNPQPGDGCEIDCTITLGAVEVIAGDRHACALFHSGQIKCWGSHDTGRLGYLEQEQDIGDDETPADSDFVDLGGIGVTQLALGSSFTCVLLDTEEVKCWGDGQHGRLGSGSVADLGSDQAPVDIDPISLGGGAVQIAAGEQHACALLVTGEVRCWGRNNYGQVGLPGETMVGDDELPSDLPVVDVGANVEAIAAGNDHTCALLGGGEVRCWGRDNFGQLGTPDSDAMIGDDESPSASSVVMLSAAAVMIDARYDHTCVAYDQGEVQCWGAGGAGRLGYGDTDVVGDDEDVSLVDPIVLGGGVPTHLATGMAHTCVRLETTEVYCWGEGNNGRLGYGNTDDLFAPAKMQVPINLALAPGMVTSGEAFSCARTEGSEVKCWGSNDRGQLGYGRAWTTDLGTNEPIESIGAVLLQ